MRKYLRIEEIKLTLKEEEGTLASKIQKILGISEVPRYTLVKKSIDSRDKGNILFIYSVDVDILEDDPRFSRSILEKAEFKKHRVRFVEEFVYDIPRVHPDPKRKRPVVVGSGTAGLFA